MLSRTATRRGGLHRAKPSPDRRDVHMPCAFQPLHRCGSGRSRKPVMSKVMVWRRISLRHGARERRIRAALTAGDRDLTALPSTRQCRSRENARHALRTGAVLWLCAPSGRPRTPRSWFSSRSALGRRNMRSEAPDAAMSTPGLRRDSATHAHTRSHLHPRPAGQLITSGQEQQTYPNVGGSSHDRSDRRLRPAERLARAPDRMQENR